MADSEVMQETDQKEALELGQWLESWLLLSNLNSDHKMKLRLWKMCTCVVMASLSCVPCPQQSLSCTGGKMAESSPWFSVISPIGNIFLNISTFVYLFIWGQAYTCQHMNVEVKEQLVGVFSNMWVLGTRPTSSGLKSKYLNHLSYLASHTSHDISNFRVLSQ